MTSLSNFFQFIDSKAIQPSGRFQYLELGDLLITGVKLDDVGKYTCVKSNDGGSVEASAFISVLGKTELFLFNIFKYPIRKSAQKLVFMFDNFSTNSNNSTPGGYASSSRKWCDF